MHPDQLIHQTCGCCALCKDATGGCVGRARMSDGEGRRPPGGPPRAGDCFAGPGCRQPVSGWVLPGRGRNAFGPENILCSARKGGLEDGRRWWVLWASSVSGIPHLDPAPVGRLVLIRKKAPPKPGTAPMPSQGIRAVPVYGETPGFSAFCVPWAEAGRIRACSCPVSGSCAWDATGMSDSSSNMRMRNRV